MNPFEMVVLIVAIFAVAGILRAKYANARPTSADEAPARNPDAERLQQEIRSLRERVAVLERIATDSNSRGSELEREIEALRRAE